MLQLTENSLLGDLKIMNDVRFSFISNCQLTPVTIYLSIVSPLQTFQFSTFYYYIEISVLVYRHIYVHLNMQFDC